MDLRKFFDEIFITGNNLEELDIKYPMKLEYYKTSTEVNTENKYGIEIVKTEYLENDIQIETAEIKNITNNEQEQEKLLNLLKNNTVTPIGAQDVIEDLLQK